METSPSNRPRRQPRDHLAKSCHPLFRNHPHHLQPRLSWSLPTPEHGRRYGTHGSYALCPARPNYIGHSIAILTTQVFKMPHCSVTFPYSECRAMATLSQIGMSRPGRAAERKKCTFIPSALPRFHPATVLTTTLKLAQCPSHYNNFYSGFPFCHSICLHIRT